MLCIPMAVGLTNLRLQAYHCIFKTHSGTSQSQKRLTWAIFIEFWVEPPAWYSTLLLLTISSNLKHIKAQDSRLIIEWIKSRKKLLHFALDLINHIGMSRKQFASLLYTGHITTSNLESYLYIMSIAGIMKFIIFFKQPGTIMVEA